MQEWKCRSDNGWKAAIRREKYKIPTTWALSMILWLLQRHESRLWARLQSTNKAVAVLLAARPSQWCVVCTNCRVNLFISWRTCARWMTTDVYHYSVCITWLWTWDVYVHSKLSFSNNIWHVYSFLADRTNGRAIATLLRLSSSSSVTLCIVAKGCVLEHKILWRAYRKSYMRNRLVPKWMTLTFV